MGASKNWLGIESVQLGCTQIKCNYMFGMKHSEVYDRRTRYFLTSEEISCFLAHHSKMLESPTFCHFKMKVFHSFFQKNPKTIFLHFGQGWKLVRFRFGSSPYRVINWAGLPRPGTAWQAGQRAVAQPMKCTGRACLTRVPWPYKLSILGPNLRPITRTLNHQLDLQEDRYLRQITGLGSSA